MPRLPRPAPPATTSATSAPARTPPRTNGKAEASSASCNANGRTRSSTPPPPPPRQSPSGWTRWYNNHRPHGGHRQGGRLSSTPRSGVLSDPCIPETHEIAACRRTSGRRPWFSSGPWSTIECVPDHGLMREAFPGAATSFERADGTGLRPPTTEFEGRSTTRNNERRTDSAPRRRASVAPSGRSREPAFPGAAGFTDRLRLDHWTLSGIEAECRADHQDYLGDLAGRWKAWFAGPPARPRRSRADSPSYPPPSRVPSPRSTTSTLTATSSGTETPGLHVQVRCSLSRSSSLCSTLRASVDSPPSANHYPVWGSRSR